MKTAKQHPLRLIILLSICSGLLYGQTYSQVPNQHPSQHLEQIHGQNLEQMNARPLPDHKEAAITQLPIYIEPTYNYLYSTHATKFTGFGLRLETSLSAKLQIGIGTDFIDCPYHGDNGLNLYHLHLVPVFVSAKWHIWGNDNWHPYVKTEIGVSFNHYTSQHQHPSGAPLIPVKETGLYTYGAVGTSRQLAKHFQFFIDVGLIGYKMSFRALDINPHSVCGKTGLIIIL